MWEVLLQPSEKDSITTEVALIDMVEAKGDTERTIEETFFSTRTMWAGRVKGSNY